MTKVFMIGASKGLGQHWTEAARARGGAVAVRGQDVLDPPVETNETRCLRCTRTSLPPQCPDGCGPADSSALWLVRVAVTAA